MRYLCLLLPLLMACSSKNETYPSQDELAQKDLEFHKTAADNQSIIVIESFHPTIEISEEIKNTVIDSLILRQLKVHCNSDVGVSIALARAGKVIVPVAVPKNSNLAKAFLLEDFWNFYDQNREYINNINTSKPSKPKSREDWDKYL